MWRRAATRENPRSEARRMTAEAFFTKIRTYADLSVEAERAWGRLLRRKQYCRDEHFISEGDVPKAYAFVEGLFYQHYTGPDGNTFVKYFFPENRIAASVSATLLGKPSLFAITAIEDSTVLEYDFAGFRKLVSEFSDIRAFYIRCVEQHGIIEKEPDEVLSGTMMRWSATGISSRRRRTYTSD